MKPRPTIVAFERASTSGRAWLWIGAAVLLAFHNAWDGAWILDDFSSVVENGSIRRLGSLDWLSPPTEAGTGGRPVANFTLAANYAMSGLAPWSYRGTNIALHALSALLLYAVTRRTWRLSGIAPRLAPSADDIALAIAVLWAVHPLQTNAVDYVAQRTELLATFFYLATIYAFLRALEPGRRGWKIAAPVLCAAGMASKEVMVTAPVLLLLFDGVFVAGSLREAWRQRWALHGSLALTWLLLGALIVHSNLSERGVGFGQGVSSMDYWLIQSFAHVRYAMLAVWPQPLVFDYGWIDAPTGAHAVLAAGIWGALAIGTCGLLFRRPRVGFFPAAFFLILAPTSSVVPIVQQPIAESRMYLALAPLIAAAVVGGFLLAPRFTRIGAIGITLAFVLLTMARNADYRSESGLWEDTIAKRPENARAHSNLAAAFLRAHRPGEAIEPSRKAAALRPNYPEAHNNLGLALAATGQAAATLKHFDRTIQLRPTWVAARFNRGDALFRMGRIEEAVAAFEASLHLQPNHAASHNNLAVAFRALGRTPDSLRHAQAAVQVNPAMAEAHYNLANALAESGSPVEAMGALQRALELQPNFPRALNNLGVLELRAGKLESALRRFDAALALQPDYAEARRNRDLADRPPPKPALTP